MLDLWNYLKNTNKPIVLYGMGNGADKILSVLQKYGIKVSGVFASDTFVREKIFHGFRVTDFATAQKSFGKMIVLVCFGSGLLEVISNIRRISEQQELYAPDVPVYGDTLFTKDFAVENRERLERIYNLLADESSKKVFENTVMYKLTGKIQYLFDCETPINEVYSSFLHFCDDETYLDLGAYRGDTVFEFLNHTKKYNKIIAVEPDIKTYKKLCLATEGVERIENINACVCDIVGSRAFSMNGSRGSAMGGETQIKSVTVDSILNGDAATYIKMDIEGEETAAIKGAKKTIIKYKPKMQIAAYHRSEDMFAVPEEVLKLRKDYKIYLRHYPCLPAWDMSYFFI